MDERFLPFKNFILKDIEDGVLSGAVYGVNIDGQTVFKGVDGYSDSERKIPITENNIFRLASMTKPITAVACLICEEKGLLSVEDKVSKYIPEFADLKVGELKDGVPVYKEETQREMTIRDILCHGSGLGSGSLGEYYVNHRDKPETLKEAVKEYGRWYLEFSPSEKCSYSAVVALDVVARIISIVSGYEYTSFLKKFILDPLEMTDTAYKLSASQKQRLVKFYTVKEDKTIGLNAEFDSAFEGLSEGYPCGAANLFGTFSDYMNFASMLACGGVFKGKRILKEETINKMRTAQFPSDYDGIDEYNNWGLGVHVRGVFHEKYQPLPERSFGWSGAYNTHFFVCPEQRLCAVMMNNLNRADLIGKETTLMKMQKAISKGLGIIK